MQGELLYEAKVKLLPGVDIGFVPEGWRINFAFTGDVSGPKISGKLDGVDYLLIRPDRVGLLHVHGVITTDGGDRISIEVSAFATDTPEGRRAIKGALTFQTGSKEFAWLNSTRGYEEGYADMEKGELNVKVFIL
ncbi:MAG: DUF3237 domain-containing protein [Chloroflexi bacterium]|nr:DUF3237 domain-containing protein [Chloroflexota bacterium]